MEKTTITIDFDKQEIQSGITAIIEQLSLYPLQTDEHSRQEIFDYNTGMGIIFACLRSTF